MEFMLTWMRKITDRSTINRLQFISIWNLKEIKTLRKFEKLIKYWLVKFSLLLFISISLVDMCVYFKINFISYRCSIYSLRNSLHIIIQNTIQHTQKCAFITFPYSHWLDCSLFHSGNDEKLDKLQSEVILVSCCFQNYFELVNVSWNSSENKFLLKFLHVYTLQN